MKQRSIKGEVIENGFQPKTVIRTIRFTQDEDLKIKTLMEKNYYRNFSMFIRDLLFKKRIVARKEVVEVTDTDLRDKINVMIYQVNKIGNNYNQYVSTFQRIVKTLSSGGDVSAGIRVAEEKTERLMHLTESLRDEVAVMIGLFDKASKRNTSIKQL